MTIKQAICDNLVANPEPILRPREPYFFVREIDVRESKFPQTICGLKGVVMFSAQAVKAILELHDKEQLQERITSAGKYDSQ